MAPPSRRSANQDHEGVRHDCNSASDSSKHVGVAFLVQRLVITRPAKPSVLWSAPTHPLSSRGDLCITAFFRCGHQEGLPSVGVGLPKPLGCSRLSRRTTPARKPSPRRPGNPGTSMMYSTAARRSASRRCTANTHAGKCHDAGHCGACSMLLGEHVAITAEVGRNPQAEVELPVGGKKACSCSSEEVLHSRAPLFRTRPAWASACRFACSRQRPHAYMSAPESEDTSTQWGGKQRRRPRRRRKPAGGRGGWSYGQGVRRTSTDGVNSCCNRGTAACPSPCQAIPVLQPELPQPSVLVLWPPHLDGTHARSRGWQPRTSFGRLHRLSSTSAPHKPPLSTNVGASGIPLREEPESAIHGPGRRPGSGPIGAATWGPSNTFEEVWLYTTIAPWHSSGQRHPEPPEFGRI